MELKKKKIDLKKKKSDPKNHNCFPLNLENIISLKLVNKMCSIGIVTTAMSYCPYCLNAFYDKINIC